jgi:hypothetical protein
VATVAAVATLEVAVAFSVASAEATSGVAAVSAEATLVGLRGIISPAIASHNTKESTLPSTEIISTTEIISGTTDISFSEEIRFCMITHTTIGMITHTTMGMITHTMTIMGTMPTTISGVTYNAGDHDGQPSVGEGNTIIAVQQELTQLGYYHGPAADIGMEARIGGVTHSISGTMTTITNRIRRIVKIGRTDDICPALELIDARFVAVLQEADCPCPGEAAGAAGFPISRNVRSFFQKGIRRND